MWNVADGRQITMNSFVLFYLCGGRGPQTTVPHPDDAAAAPGGWSSGSPIGAPSGRGSGPRGRSGSRRCRCDPAVGAGKGGGGHADRAPGGLVVSTAPSQKAQSLKMEKVGGKHSQRKTHKPWKPLKNRLANVAGFRKAPGTALGWGDPTATACDPEEGAYHCSVPHSTFGTLIAF